MVQTPVKTLTREEFLLLPETKPASEYIDGEIIQKPMPQGEHSVLQAELTTAINAILKPQKLGRAFPELRCIVDNRVIVPDISVFSWSRIPRKINGEVANVFTLAPDWLVEILSPEQSQTKVINKILHALEHGTEMAWMIDSQEKSVLVFSPNQRVKMFTELSETLRVPDFAENLNLTVEELFEWLKC